MGGVRQWRMDELCEMKKVKLEMGKEHASQHVTDQVFEDVWVWVAETVGSTGGWKVGNIREYINKHYYEDLEQ